MRIMSTYNTSMCYNQRMTEIIRREIRAQLARRALSQKDLAEPVGVSEGQISRMMSGSSQGKVSVWLSIFDYLELDLVVVPR